VHLPLQSRSFRAAGWLKAAHWPLFAARRGLFDSMAELIDLGLFTDANRLLEKLIEQHGINWFLAHEGKRLMALEKAKIDLVVRTAVRSRERKELPVQEPAVEQCRKQVRRALIRRVAEAMVGTGC
jgi:hypothetical protein